MPSEHVPACLRLSLSYLQGVFAGRVPGGQWRPCHAHDAADGGYDTLAVVDHVAQDVLCDGDGSQVVKLHQTAENIDVGVNEERALAPPTVIHQHVYLQRS